jgi:hypothetical protein
MTVFLVSVVIECLFHYITIILGSCLCLWFVHVGYTRPARRFRWLPYGCAFTLQVILILARLLLLMSKIIKGASVRVIIVREGGRQSIL